MITILQYFNFSKKLDMVIRILSYAISDLFYFFSIYCLMILGFSIICTMNFGYAVTNYKNLGLSMLYNTLYLNGLDMYPFIRPINEPVANILVVVYKITINLILVNLAYGILDGYYVECENPMIVRKDRSFI